MVNILFSFHGRLARLRYFLLGILSSALIAGTIAAVIANSGGSRVPLAIMVVGIGAVLIVALICGLSALVRRLHDLNLSGWWALAVIFGPVAAHFAPELLAGNPKAGEILSRLAGLLVALWLLFQSGTPGPNRFGPDPKGSTVAKESDDPRRTKPTLG